MVLEGDSTVNYNDYLILVIVVNAFCGGYRGGYRW